jgi:GT2 family glycosyltransferase
VAYNAKVNQTDVVVSFIISSCARRELLYQLLKYLPDIPGPTRDIVVVDDASQDGTTAMLATEFPEIKVLRNDRPRGFDALPEAIRMTRGQFIFQLDDDAYPQQETLLKVLEHFKRRGPKLGMVALPFIEPRSGRTMYTPYFPAVPQGEVFAPTRGFMAGGVVFRREAVLKIPPSPPGYFMFGSEAPTVIEYLVQGWQADFLPGAPVYHLWEGRQRIKLMHAYYPLRNDLVTIQRYYRGLTRWEMLVGRYIAGFVALFIAGCSAELLRARREAKEMLRRLEPRQAPEEVLRRVYRCFDGVTLRTLASKTNLRRLAWALGILPIDQAG